MKNLVLVRFNAITHSDSAEPNQNVAGRAYELIKGRLPISPRDPAVRGCAHAAPADRSAFGRQSPGAL